MVECSFVKFIENFKLNVEKQSKERYSSRSLNGGRVYFRFTDFQIFLIVEFFLWSPVAPELGTDPRLDLARTAP